MLFGEAESWVMYGGGAAIISLLGTLVTLAWNVTRRLAMIDILTSRIGQLEFRIETMSLFYVRRALVEGVHNNTLVAGPDGSWRASQQALGWFGPLAKKLKDLHRSLPQGTSDSILIDHIERQYGQDIVNDVCLPTGRRHGECMLVALEVAKSPD